MKRQHGTLKSRKDDKIHIREVDWEDINVTILAQHHVQ
jgi:hypothetical protein